MRNNDFFLKITTGIFLTCFIFFAAIIKAAPVDSLTAKTVAVNFYANNYQVNVYSASLTRTEKSSTGEPEYYIFNINTNSGFVIVSADDAAHPIIGYSSEGYYHLNNPAPEFQFWMVNYKNQIDQIRLNNTTASVDIINEWSAYKNNLLSTLNTRSSSITPLVKTIWAQAPYYNSLCPGGAVAGCIATAMGQIMKYWEYPPHGIDSNSYTDNPYGVLTANFDTTKYNWAAMPLNVNTYNSEVAKLTYDCGISVQMSYSDTASGSFMITGDNPVCSQSAFVKYFGYNGSTIQGIYNYDYYEPDWISLLENELNNGRPFQYAGTGSQGSHSWVCDGYDKNDNFHMNWGWGGYEDGYFSLSSLNPANTPLSSGQEALIGIQPAAAVAVFSATPLFVRAGDTVKFTDNSFGYIQVTGWQWLFTGGENANSTIQNPMVVYNTPGQYTVSETVTNNQGSSTLTLNNYITVLQNNTVNVYPTLNNGTFTAQLHDASIANSNLEFSLYNILGQKVYTTTLVQFKTQLSVTLPHGIYLFRAVNVSGKPVSAGKMVIE